MCATGPVLVIGGTRALNIELGIQSKDNASLSNLSLETINYIENYNYYNSLKGGNNTLRSILRKFRKGRCF